MPDTLKWAAAICLALAIFAIAIMAVGYKPPSIGRVATVVLLAVGATGCLYASTRRKAKTQ